MPERSYTIEGSWEGNFKPDDGLRIFSKPRRAVTTLHDMRRDCLALWCVLVLAGCGGNRAGNSHRSAPISLTNKPPVLIVTPATGTTGRVALVNVRSHFVVVSYSFGNVPAADRRLNVYRQGLKVAEIKINDVRRDTNIVADIVAGECQVGDEVREE